MQYPVLLTREALIVGVIFVVLTGLLHGAEMGVDHLRGNAKPNLSHNELMARMMVRAFLAGALGHVALDVAGINKLYCVNPAYKARGQ